MPFLTLYIFSFMPHCWESLTTNHPKASLGCTQLIGCFNITRPTEGMGWRLYFPKAPEQATHFLFLLEGRRGICGWCDTHWPIRRRYSRWCHYWPIRKLHFNGLRITCYKKAPSGKNLQWSFFRQWVIASTKTSLPSNQDTSPQMSIFFCWIWHVCTLNLLPDAPFRLCRRRSPSFSLSPRIYSMNVCVRLRLGRMSRKRERPIANDVGTGKM